MVSIIAIVVEQIPNIFLVSQTLCWKNQTEFKLNACTKKILNMQHTFVNVKKQDDLSKGLLYMQYVSSQALMIAIYCTKAELLQEGIFFPHPFICQRRFSNEKVGNQKN